MYVPLERVDILGLDDIINDECLFHQLALNEKDKNNRNEKYYKRLGCYECETYTKKCKNYTSYSLIEEGELKYVL
jgi:hypothetical protein